MAAETKAHKKVKTPHGFPLFLYLIQSGVMLSRFLGLIECSYWSDLGVCTIRSSLQDFGSGPYIWSFCTPRQGPGETQESKRRDRQHGSGRFWQ